MMTSEKTDRCRKKGRTSPRTGMVGTLIGLGVYSLAAALAMLLWEGQAGVFRPLTMEYLGVYYGWLLVRAAALLLPPVTAMAILARGAKKRGEQRDVLFLKLFCFVLILFILADSYQDYMIYDRFQSSRSLQLILAALILYIGGVIYSSRFLKAAAFLHLAVILLIVSLTLLRWSGLLEGEGPVVTYRQLLCVGIAYPALGYFLLAAGLWLAGRRERRAEKTAGPGGRLSGEPAVENGENDADRGCREESGRRA